MQVGQETANDRTLATHGRAGTILASSRDKPVDVFGLNILDAGVPKRRKQCRTVIADVSGVLSADPSMLQEVLGVIREQLIVGTGWRRRKGRKDSLLPQISDKSCQRAPRNPAMWIPRIATLKKWHDPLRQMIEGTIPILRRKLAETKDATSISTHRNRLYLPGMQFLQETTHRRSQP